MWKNTIILREWLIKKCYGLTSECLQDFKNKGGITSGPTPDWLFNESSISKISNSDIFQELIYLDSNH